MGDETLPYAADTESPLTDDELAVLRRQYEQEGDVVSVQTKFNYAWGLVKSSRQRDQLLGVKLLAELFRDAPSRRRECLYYLAVGHYRLGNYSEAKRYNQVLLAREPTNPQAIDLQGLIDHKVNREGLVGVAIISGVVAVSGVLLGTLLSRSHRR